jgi:hypothetical protein
MEGIIDEILNEVIVLISYVGIEGPLQGLKQILVRGLSLQSRWTKSLLKATASGPTEALDDEQECDLLVKASNVASLIISPISSVPRSSVLKLMLSGVLTIPTLSFLCLQGRWSTQSHHLPFLKMLQDLQSGGALKSEKF